MADKLEEEMRLITQGTYVASRLERASELLKQLEDAALTEDVDRKAVVAFRASLNEVTKAIEEICEAFVKKHGGPHDWAHTAGIGEWRCIKCGAVCMCIGFDPDSGDRCIPNPRLRVDPEHLPPPFHRPIWRPKLRGG